MGMILFFNAKERKGKRKVTQSFFEIQINKILPSYPANIYLFDYEVLR